jgi:hypothetical protein
MTDLSVSASPLRTSLLLLLIFLVAGVFGSLFVTAFRMRESAILATAGKACGTRDMSAKLVGRDIVCVDKDGRLFEVPKKAS